MLYLHGWLISIRMRVMKKIKAGVSREEFRPIMNDGESRVILLIM